MLTTFLVGPWAGTLAEEANTALESADAIHVAIFDLDAGSIYVNVPDDLRPGDTGSGTVSPIPAGTDESERARQHEELSGYRVVLAGQPAPVSEEVRTFRLPADAKTLTIALVDRQGRPAGEVKAPLGPAPSAPASYDVPSLGQSGAPVRIAGPFDGELANTSVRIGGTEAEKVAESPRQVVVRGPQEGAAAAPVEVRERGAVVTTGTYRNVDVRLAAGATTLHSGERTTLTVTVTGVEGLRETLPVRLRNDSPGVVRVEGGEEQTLCVRPDDVKTNGTWTASRGLTGVKLGAFSIGAEVSTPRPHAESRVRVAATLQGELRAGVVLERPAHSATGETLGAGSYAVRVRGTGESGKVDLLLGRRGQLVGALPGAVFQRVGSATLCDRDDVSDAVEQARAGTGEPSFHDLGFEDDEAFAVREDAAGLRLVLATDEEDFTIEADLAAPLP